MRSLTASRAPDVYRAKPLAGPDAIFQAGGNAKAQPDPKLRLRGGRLFRRRAGRADPAPSRLSYRLQRWMLTPGIRRGLKIGLPLGALAAAIGLFFTDETRRDALTAQVDGAITAFQERPEFMVKLMAIDGAGSDLSDDIREVVPLDFPISSWDLDVAQIRDTITGLDPVKSASVRIRPGGILQVDVIERLPVVVWRSRDGLSLLDETGAHVAALSHRALRADLPLIAGRGADRHVPEALALIAAARPLGARLRGLVRVGQRRWDVVLDRGQRVQLPSEEPVRALERVLALNEVQDLLERDVAVVDMRLGARPTIRMTEYAVTNWWKIRKMDGSGQ